MAKKLEETYFIGLKNPTDLRKEILGTTKQIIQLLQKYHHFKEIKDEKTALAEKLKSLMTEIDELNGRFKIALPKSKINALPNHLKKLSGKTLKGLEPKPQPAPQRVEEPKEKPKAQQKPNMSVEGEALPKQPPKPKDDLEDLEDQIDEIERKLENI